MTDHGEESKNAPVAQPESIGKKLRNVASQLGQFCLGAGIALVTLGVLTGLIALVLLGIRQFR
jgi:hypothetical protein